MLIARPDLARDRYLSASWGDEARGPEGFHRLFVLKSIWVVARGTANAQLNLNVVMHSAAADSALALRPLAFAHAARRLIPEDQIGLRRRP